MSELKMSTGSSSSNSVLHSHQFRSYMNVDTPGKSMVNLEHYNDFGVVSNCHHPFGPDRCVSVVGDRKWLNSIHQENVFRYHHYSGSLEVFLSRPGRTADYFWYRNKATTIGTTDSLTAWYPQFVELVGGPRVAQRLTTDAYQTSLEEWNDLKARVDEGATRDKDSATATIPLAFPYDRPNPTVFLREQLQSATSM